MGQRSAILWCVVLATVSGYTGGQVASAQDRGSEGCPCIDPWAGYPEECRITESTGACLAADYGASVCGPWDCNNATGAGCERRWCYVDPGNCDRAVDLSFHFPSLGLHYSYGACGHVRWSLDDDPAWILGDLMNSTLRIAYPGDSASGYTLVTAEPGCQGAACEKTGSMVEFAHAALREAGITTQAVLVPQVSKDAYPKSSFTACVHAVSLGAVDMCIGNFYTTPERYTLATFLTTIYVDSLRVVTYRVVSGDKTFYENLRTPYRPFTFSLWLAIFAVSIVVAATFWLVDAEYNDKDFDANDKGVVGGIGKSIYNSMMGMGGGGSMFTAHTLAAKFVNLGFALFIVTMLAAYTANLASFFVTQQVSTEVDDLDAAIRQGLKICTIDAVQSTLVQGIGSHISERLVITATPAENLEKMDSGECQVSIMAEDFFKKSQSRSKDEGRRRRNLLTAQHVSGAREAPAGALEGDPTGDSWRRRLLKGGATKAGGGAGGGAVADANSITGIAGPALSQEMFDKYHCNKVMIGGPVMTIPNSMPVRQDIQHRLSWLMARSLSRGNYAKFTSEAKAQFLPQQVCGGVETLGVGTGTEAMTVTQFLGPLVSCLIFCGAALFVFVIGERNQLKRHIKQIKQLKLKAHRKPSARGRQAATAGEEVESDVEEEEEEEEEEDILADTNGYGEAKGAGADMDHISAIIQKEMRKVQNELKRTISHRQLEEAVMTVAPAKPRFFKGPKNLRQQLSHLRQEEAIREKLGKDGPRNNFASVVQSVMHAQSFTNKTKLLVTVSSKDDVGKLSPAEGANAISVPDSSDEPDTVDDEGNEIIVELHTH